MSLPASSYLPSGLAEGNIFRLTFVTNLGMVCVDSSLPLIQTYNNFVQTQWQASYIRPVIEQYLGVSITFKCIASTQAVNAKDNIFTGDGGGGATFVGVYTLNQGKIVDTTNNLWTTNTLDLQNPISTDQTGSTLSGPVNVWTGTDVNGDAAGYLGQDCASCINVGSSSAEGTGWINATTVPSCPGGRQPDKYFYALSDNITWPAPVCMVNGVWDKYQKKSPYGRWNNTNTNHKLFPMTICHGPGGKIVRKQTKNLYINTAARMSQKQTYSFLIRNGIGPYTR